VAQNNPPARALLLAAGLGSRLRPLTDHIPKCLVSIQGKPLLVRWLDLLIDGGIEAVLVNTHYRAEQVNQAVSNYRHRDKVAVVHEPILLGTGGTVIANRGFFADRPFLVAHADNLTMFDVPAFLTSHSRRPACAAITMMTFETDAPETCGIVEKDGNGIVTAFHEKASNPPGSEANAAVYIFDPEVLDFMAGLKRETIDLSTEVIPRFVGRICTFRNTIYHRDIGTLESLRKAQLEFKDNAD
jgi:mannose-1-phosphate guanylyltransferase